MINGIPVKVKSKEKGQLETLYIATFRRCPALKDKAKAIMKLFVEISSVGRKIELEQKKLDIADTEEAVDTSTQKLLVLRITEQETNDNLINECFDFIVTALTGAGYEKADAEEKAELIPFERVMDVLNASRIGAMSVLDFFTDKGTQPQS